MPRASVLVILLSACGARHPVEPDAGHPADGAMAIDATADVDAPRDGAPECSVAGVAGELDASFGAGGVVTFFGLEPGAAVAVGVAIDAASRTVVVGSNTRTARSCVVARLLPDGSRDPSFGADGLVLRHVGAEETCWYNEVVLQADGRIVAVGEIDGHGAPRALIARYLSDGQPDLAFGDGGVVLLEPHTWGMDVALDATQRILLAGSARTVAGAPTRFLTRRYLPSGMPDESFGIAGEAAPVFTESAAGAYGVQIQDDKIVVVGGVGYDAERQTFAVARYTADGVLDPGFGTTGTFRFTPTSDAGASDVRFDVEGRPIVLGVASEGEQSRGAIVLRLTDDGSLDTTFGDSTGFVLDEVSPYSSIAASTQDDGSLVAGTSAAGALTLARFTPAGELDSSFGTGGHAANVPLPWRQVGWDVAEQPDGAIVVVGGYGDVAGFDMFVARYCP